MVKGQALNLPELQSIEPTEVVRAKLDLARSLTPLRPLIVDDVGLRIPALRGFPGALLKPILELGGLRLLRDLSFAHLKEQRIDAEFVCAIAMDDGANITVQEGAMKGHLDFSNEIFIDDMTTPRCFYPDGSEKSLANLSLNDGARAFQHRFNALKKLPSLS